MAWNYDDEEINGVIDSNIKDSPPNPPAVNTASTMRSMLKLYWAVIRGQVSNAVNYVDTFIDTTKAEIDLKIANALQSVANTLTTINNNLTATLASVEARAAAAEAKANSVYNSFSLAKFQGKWVPSTNTPALTSVPAANGNWYEVSAAGTSAITGTLETYAVGDRLLGSTTAWFRIPASLIPADGTVTPEKMLPWMSNLFMQLPDDSPYKMAIMDQMNRIALAIRKDGFVEGKFVIEAISMMANAVATDTIQNGAVTVSKLAVEVLNLLIQSFDATDSNYWFLIADAMNRIGFAISKDGTVTAKINIADGSITASKLAADVLAQMLPASFKRLNDFNINDVEVDLEDEWRLNEFSVLAKRRQMALLIPDFHQWQRAHLGVSITKLVRLRCNFDNQTG